MSNRTRTAIQVEFRGGGVSGKGKIRNVSEGGLFLATRAIPEQGETVWVRIATPGLRIIEVSGMVWWTTRDAEGSAKVPGFGLRLLEESDDYRGFVDGLNRRR